MSEKPANETPEKPEITEEAPIVTSHQLDLADSTLSYSATVGKMPLKDEKAQDRRANLLHRLHPRFRLRSRGAPV